MFKKEKNGKTNRKLQRGGEMIGFSFYIDNDYITYNDLDFFKNTNRDC